MLIHTPTQQVVLDGSAEASAGRDFFIAQDAVVTQQLSSMMRNMYSDIHWAVLREYITNGLDANPHKPVRVTLPTATSSELRIADEGPGLGFAEMQEMLTGFGNSNKRGRKTKIGGFGIGAKCGMAYTDSFTYESVYCVNGVKWRTMMLCFLDNDGKAKCKFTHHKKVDRSTHTGITVIIPVAANDRTRFYTAFSKFEYAPHLAKRIIVTNAKAVTSSASLCFNDDDTLATVGVVASKDVSVGKFTIKVNVHSTHNTPYCGWSSTSWALGKLYVILAGVPYQCTWSDVFTTSTRSCFAQAQRWGGQCQVLSLEIPPEAEIAPTPSREAIILSPRAAALIVNAVDAMARDVSPEAIWRQPAISSLPADSTVTPTTWLALGMRMRPFVPAGGASLDLMAWCRTQLDEVSKAYGLDHFVLSASGRTDFKIPKGWRLVEVQCRNSKLSLQACNMGLTTNSRVTTTTTLYPVYLSSVPKKVMDAYEAVKTYTFKGQKGDVSRPNESAILKLIPPRLRIELRAKAIELAKNPITSSISSLLAVLVEDPEEKAGHEVIANSDLVLADAAAEYFTWKAIPRPKSKPKPAAGAADATTADVVPAVVKPALVFDFSVISTYGTVENPSSFMEDDYGKSGYRTSYVYAWGHSADVEKLAAKFLKRLGPDAPDPSICYFKPGELDQHKDEDRRGKLLWPLFAVDAPAYINSRPKAIADWLKCQPQISICNQTWPKDFWTQLKQMEPKLKNPDVTALLKLMRSSEERIAAKELADADITLYKIMSDVSIGDKLPLRIFNPALSTPDTTNPTPDLVKWARKLKFTTDPADMDPVSLRLSNILNSQHPIADLFKLGAGYIGDCSASRPMMELIESGSKVAGFRPQVWKAICQFK